MANTVQSRKAKARRLQQETRDLLLEHFSQLTDGDVVSVPMGVSGEDLLLSPLAREVLRCSFECKNQEKLSLWKELDQTEKNAAKVGRHPVLVFRKNGAPSRVVIRTELFVKMLSELHKAGINI